MGALYGETMVPMKLQELLELEEALWGANKTALKWARRGLVGGWWVQLLVQVGIEEHTTIDVVAKLSRAFMKEVQGGAW